jgi:hypothetical protein
MHTYGGVEVYLRTFDAKSRSLTSFASWPVEFRGSHSRSGRVAKENISFSKARTPDSAVHLVHNLVAVLTEISLPLVGNGIMSNFME